MKQMQGAFKNNKSSNQETGNDPRKSKTGSLKLNTTTNNNGNGKVGSFIEFPEKQDKPIF